MSEQDDKKAKKPANAEGEPKPKAPKAAKVATNESAPKVESRLLALVEDNPACHKPTTIFVDGNLCRSRLQSTRTCLAASGGNAHVP